MREEAVPGETDVERLSNSVMNRRRVHSGSGRTPSTSPGRIEFHERLLQPTLRNAARTPFYRGLWEGTCFETITLESLAKLPLIRKADLLEAGTHAQIRGDQVCEEVFSSGTTGTPFVAIRGQREQQRVAELFNHLNVTRSARHVERGLQITNPQHGTLVRVPTALRFHSVSIYDRHCFTHAVRILASVFDEPGVSPRCTILVTAERCLRAFTQYLEANAITMASDPGRSAITFGSYVSQHLRDQVRQTLGMGIIDRFSLSEVFGGATECQESGWYYFDPLIIPEVVSLNSGQTLSEGIGELVLTALFPFQECQPIVRYATGDLVRVTHQSEQFPGRLGFKPLGRVASAVLSPLSGDLLLSAIDLYEAIDSQDWPFRNPFFQDAREVVDGDALGDPRYDVRCERAQSRELIEVRVQAAAVRETQRDNERARAVRENLLYRAPVLREKVNRGRAVLKVSLVDSIETSWVV